METIINSQIWKILELFYKNKNQPLHLREISRQINLREGALTRHLNYLAKSNILKFRKEANLKKFYINQNEIPKIYPFFDISRFEKLPMLRKNAIEYYIKKTIKKPIFLILFGSTAKGNYTEDSDLDLIEIYNEKTNTDDAIKFAEAQTGIRISGFQITFKQFIEEIKLKNEPIIQSALETGFPIYNQKYFYEVLIDERK